MSDLDLRRAVELLERCLDEIDCDIYDDPCTQQLVTWCKDFLSRSKCQLRPRAEYCEECSNRADIIGWQEEHIHEMKSALQKCAAARELLEALANATIERLSNGWEMLDGDSNRAVSAAELARRAARKEKP